MRYLLLCTLIAIAATSCKKEATVWESDWNAPLVNDTLSLANLVNDSTLSVSNGYYAVNLTRSLFDVSISDLVEIPDTTIQKNYPSSVNLELNPGFTYAGSEETYDLELGDVQLKTITLEEGFIDVKLENPIETVVYFIIKLEKVTDDNGIFIRTIPAPAAANGQPGVAEATLDLSGYTMDLSGEFGGGYNQLIADFSVVTDPNGSSAWIYNGDVTRVEATFRDVKIFYAQGYFGNRVISDTTTIDLTELDIYQSGLLDISNLWLNFEVENGVKAGAVANIHMVRNTNKQGNVVNLMGPNIGNDITVNPATGNWGTLSPSLTNVTFNASNSNIEAYVENLGVKHEVGYTFELNPWGNVSGGWDQVFPQSRVRVNLNAEMPLSIGMDALTLQDTFDLTLNQDPEKTRIVAGDLILNAKNGFPFSANITMYLLGANGALLHTIQGTDIIESSQYGVLDANTNVLVQPSEVIFSLPDNVISDINDVQQVVVRAEMNSPNPATGVNQQILIPENAFIEVKLRSEFKTENKF
ncbi:MAG: hypothetical protein NXI10_11220 [bacterium]|nr:hypothetical protein [bacterium]